MRLVVDANVLFSALIKDGKTAKIILDLGLELYAPKFVMVEFEKYKEEVLRKTKRSECEFYEILDIFYKLIRVVDYCEYEKFVNEALFFCSD